MLSTTESGPCRRIPIDCTHSTTRTRKLQTQAGGGLQNSSDISGAVPLTHDTAAMKINQRTITWHVDSGHAPPGGTTTSLTLLLRVL